MKRWMQYLTLLEGSRADLIENEQTMILFNLSPFAWQINYKWPQATVQALTNT